MPSDQRARIVICHPEVLLGQALSAAIAGLGLADDPQVVATTDDVLAHLQLGLDLAVVSDTVGDELGELLEALTHRGSTLPVLVLVRHGDFRAAAHALELGAAGSVRGDAALPTLKSAVQAARAGQVVFLDGDADEVRRALNERQAERTAAEALYRSLTERDRAIVAALAQGSTPGEIATGLALSPHTIRAAVRALGDKLDAKGQLGIAAASRELLHAITPPSRRFLDRRPSLAEGTRAG